MTHGIEKIINAKRTVARRDSARETTLKDIGNQSTADTLNVDRKKLISVLVGIVDILRRSHAWYKKQKKKEEEVEVKKVSNLEAVDQLSSSSIDIAPRKEPPTTPTITPSKTLINSLNHNPSDYFDDRLEKLTLNPIGRLQSLSSNVLPENSQTLKNIEKDTKSPMVAHLQAVMEDSAAKPIGNVTRADHEKILHQIATGHIGPKDEESKFSYWCGFCKEIKTVEKTGVDALNERFDHIDLHFQKNENIKRWVPAKGHTEKGAQKRRDKSRKKESKRTATSRREDDSGVLYDNGYNDGDYSTYEECPSSADEACIEDKSHPDSYGESNKSRKLEQVETGEVSIYCCRCDGLLPIMALRCVECEHDSCSLCKREKRGPDRLL
ncbi:uncharacterized protein BHQ10_008724 [Talaromyces amestolkiae]|uniref:Uncharacterized protein n=1 Tax=Talaromyces amestolkiae TaxID=1196081 RepID=A0A364LA72_TALAM|nr:uncharacterized protein BHQ10_008724 [Talaromyces amestolkiae]RAO72712.1 hypothetical protein BHQ10_008724 [Talaromyces amestolkiae]